MSRRKSNAPGCFVSLLQILGCVVVLSLAFLGISFVAELFQVSAGWAIVIIMLIPSLFYLGFLLIRAIVRKIVRIVQADCTGKREREQSGQCLPGTTAAPHDATSAARTASAPVPPARPAVATSIRQTKPAADRRRGGLGHRSDRYAPDCVVLDIAATGNTAETGEIVEVSAIRLRKLEPVDTFTSLIKPAQKLTPEQISELGITNAMLAKAPSAENVLSALWDFIDGEPLLSFETRPAVCFLYDIFLRYTDNVLSNDFMDLQRLARNTVPDTDPQSLSDVSCALRCPQATSVRTMGRCEVMAECYKTLSGMAAEQKHKTESKDVLPENTATQETVPDELVEAQTPATLDDLLIPAIDWILQEQTASASALQRQFGIGWERAKKLMEQIEFLGVVGPPNGSKSRDVLMGINPLKD